MSELDEHEHEQPYYSRFFRDEPLTLVDIMENHATCSMKRKVPLEQWTVFIHIGVVLPCCIAAVCVSFTSL